MAKKLIVAAAGSGKTTYLIEQALKSNGQTLITTFTIDNESEIKKKIIECYGYVPANIKIQTWFSFLLQHGVKPFQGSLGVNEHINVLMLVNQKSGLKFTNEKGRSLYYGKEEVRNYYFSNDMKIYSDKISAFVYECNCSTKGKVIERLEGIYENIFIDEIQDMAGYDLELISLLIKSKINVLMVGDPRQVTYKTHHELKNKKYNNGNIIGYIKDKKLINKCEIDDISFEKSHRCVESICSYASKLYPEYPVTYSLQNSNSFCEGIYIIKECDIDDYISKVRPVQLRYNAKTKVNPNYPCYTMGKSKGMTFDHVLIYPTINIKKWMLDDSIKLSDEIRSKFYVALTRAKYSVGIVWDGKEVNIDGIKLYNPSKGLN